MGAAPAPTGAEGVEEETAPDLEWPLPLPAEAEEEEEVAAAGEEPDPEAPGEDGGAEQDPGILLNRLDPFSYLYVRAFGPFFVHQ